MAASLSFRINSGLRLCRQVVKQCSLLKETRFTFTSTSKVLSSDTVQGTDSPPPDHSERDPFPIFTDSRVQDILTKITGFDIFKIAGPHKKRLQRPKYKLLTDAELKTEMSKAREQLKERLQIPPYLNPRKPKLDPLSVDPDLAHHDTASYIFTDVTFGLKDKDRSVVVREPDGTLRHAPWDVKDRMNQLYNPRPGKEYLKPRMFEEQHLERMIAEKKYVYILDRACCQFEPDDPDYVRTTHRVYRSVDAAAEYNELRSTRHFGSLAFYLVWYNMADGLLLDMLNRDLASDAADLVRLYSLVHPSSQCALSLGNLEAGLDSSTIIQTYMETVSGERSSELELAFQAMQDARRKDTNIQPQQNI